MQTTLMRTTLITLLIGVSNTMLAQETDHLQHCYQQQSLALDDKVAVFDYSEHTNNTYHSPRPWMTYQRNYTGTIWCNEDVFARESTWIRGDKPMRSRLQFADGVLLMQPFWKNEPVAVSESDIKQEPLDIAKYNPALLLKLFVAAAPTADLSMARYAMYTANIHKSVVTIYINRDKGLLEKATITAYDDMYGDVTQTINYNDYIQYKRYYYPKTVHYNKINNIADTISMNLVQLLPDMPPILEKPADYTIQKDKADVFDIKTQKLRDHIYVLHLIQAESAAMLVEFKDYFVLVDAPLNSKNGELILREADKIAPNKPIKYFAFGHHHPWYLGGVRPLIRKGATILTQADDIPYINYLATASHSMQPDSLHRKQRQVKLQTVGETYTITDGSLTMKMYHIGKQSDHTEDYTVFYFPEEKLLFEDDLVFVEEGKVRKAGTKQRGLYHAIADRSLKVDTVVQGWPWSEHYSFKMVIPYEDIKASMTAEN